MTRLYTSFNLVEVEYLQGILEESGIACTVRNIFSRADVPSPSTWPELWALHDKDVDRAWRLIAERQPEEQESQAAWTCDQCGAESEAQFTSCWNCGTEQPAAA